jgi:hypothetical protein
VFLEERSDSSKIVKNKKDKKHENELNVKWKYIFFQPKITLSGECCNILVPPNKTWVLSRLADNFSSIPLPAIEI